MKHKIAVITSALFMALTMTACGSREPASAPSVADSDKAAVDLALILRSEAICRMHRCLTVWRSKVRQHRSSAPIHNSLFVTGLTVWDLRNNIKTAVQ